VREFVNRVFKRKFGSKAEEVTRRLEGEKKILMRSVTICGGI
jgi:hypothetical protein